MQKCTVLLGWNKRTLKCQFRSTGGKTNAECIKKPMVALGLINYLRTAEAQFEAVKIITAHAVLKML